MKRAYDELKAYIDRKVTEGQRIRQWQRNSGTSPRQAIILNWLHNHPNQFLSVKEVETMLGVANQTARTDLQQLVQKGLLTEVRINQKERQFVLAQLSLTV